MRTQIKAIFANAKAAAVAQVYGYFMAYAGSSTYKAFAFSDDTGWGTQYTGPSGIGSASGKNWTSQNSTKTVVAMAGFDNGGNTALQAFPWDPAVGYGTLFSAPSGYTQYAEYGYAAFTANNGAIITEQAYTNKHESWAWNNTSGWGTKYSTLTTGTTAYGIYGVTLNDTRSVYAIGMAGAPWVAMVPWDNSSGFGSNYTNLSSSIANLPNVVTFSPDEASVIISSKDSPYPMTSIAYAWSNSSGWGSQLTKANFTNRGYSAYVKHTINKAGNCVYTYLGTNAQRGQAFAYSSSSGYGTAFSGTPLIPPSGSTGGNAPATLSFNGTDKSLIVITTNAGNTPYTNVYSWSNTTGWGSKFTNISPEQYSPTESKGGLFN